MKTVRHHRPACRRRRPAVLMIFLLGSLWGGLSAGALQAQATPSLAQELLSPGGSGSSASAPPAASATPTSTGSPAPSTQPAAQEPLPAVSELIPRVVSLSQDADQAVQTTADLADVSSLAPRLDSLKQAQAEISSQVEELMGKDYVRDERVQAVLERALEVQRQVDDAMSGASTRVDRMDALRGRWQQKQEFWTRWRDSLRSDSQYQHVYRQQFDDAAKEIGRVLDAANRTLPNVVGLQQRLQAVDAASRSSVETAQSLLRTWRQSLFRRTAPPLLSSEFRAELQDSVSGDLLATMTAAATSGSQLSARNFAVLALQVAVALLLGWLLRRVRRSTPNQSRWSTVLDHPWAIGVLVAAAGLSFLYGLLPPLGEFGIGLAVALSAVLVAAGLFDNRYKRVVAYLISSAYVVFAGLEAVALPVPLHRALLVVLTVLGIPVLLVLARRSRRSRWRHQRWFEGALRAGAIALAAVIAGELAGYHAFAQWLLEASVVTTFVGFVATFLVRLGRGGIQLLVHSAERARVGSLLRLGDILTERLLLLLQVAVVGSALLYLAVVWNLTDSVGQAWKAVVGAGFKVGASHFTVGRLLLAGLAVYLAIVASWIVRSLLDRAVFEHRRFDRGVRDSIATLLHYTLMVIGAFVALSVFGVDLSKLALIAGALSVGIGFGLQNVVNNFVSGLILLFERPVRVGDIVVMGDEQGTITKIGMRSTVLTTFNGAERIVPNADLISQQVVNWTLTTPRARLVLPIGAAYGTDPARVIAVLEDIGRGYSLALKDPPPMAIFTDFGDSSLNFELRVWLAAFEQIIQARSELATLIARRFAQEGIEIPFPQRDLHLRSVTEGSPVAAEPGPPKSPAEPEAKVEARTEGAADGDS